MKREFELGIKFHKLCLTIPGLAFLYKKRDDSYSFIAGVPELGGDGEEDSFVVQGLIPNRYYDEMKQRTSKDSPDSWFELREDDDNYNED